MEKEPVGVYEVAFHRARRGWQERERYHRAVVLEHSDGAPASDEDCQPAPWRFPGTLATEAYQLWHQAATQMTGARRTRFERRADLVRQFVARERIPDRLNDALGELLRARAQWLPVLPDSRGLLMQWGITAHRAEPFPVPAVFLSLIHGLRVRRLRSCTRCRAPFVANPRMETVCQDCSRRRRHAQALMHRAQWRRIRDRLRKGHHPAVKGMHARDRRQIIAAAYQELFRVSLSEWCQKWDRKDPKGRGRHPKEVMAMTVGARRHGDDGRKSVR